MSRSALSILVLLASSCATSADIPPRPGVREHAFAETIRESGYRCAEPATYKYLDGEAATEFTVLGLSAAKVTCNDGSAYVVAVPPKRPWRNRTDPATPGVNARPIVRPER